MKNLLILIVLGSAITFFVTLDHPLSFNTSFDKIMDQFYVSKSRMLGMVAGFEASNGENEKAVSSFNDAKVAVDSIKDTTKRVKESLNIIEKKADTNEFINETIEQKDIAKIIKEVENIPKEEKDKIFSDIVNILPKIDLQPEELSSEIKDPEDQSIFLFNTALLYLKENKQDLAIKTINEINSEYYRKIAIMILLESLSTINDKKDLIKEFKSSVWEDFVYLDSLRKILDKDNLEEAEKFVRSFKDDNLQKRGWMEIFNFQVKKGNIDSAVEILKTKID